MEHRVQLTNKEAFEIAQKLKFLDVSYVQDTYTGIKRIRHDPSGIKEKEYITSVVGTTCRLSALCKLDDIENVYFEIKWTENKVQFEIEFEDEIPVEFKERPNIKGWQILSD